MTHAETISTGDGATVTIRRVDVSAEDRANLATLADLDSRETPQGVVLGAEVRGRLVAAISLDSAEVVADPFSRTGEFRSLLELRAAQVSRGASKWHRLLAPRRSGRAAVGGSPPGQIISLPRWS